MFGGIFREHTNDKGEKVERRRVNRAVHRDLSACLGIFVHWAHKSLGIDLPDHFKTAAQRAADKKSRDTSGEKPSKRDTSQVLKKA